MIFLSHRGTAYSGISPKLGPKLHRWSGHSYLVSYRVDVPIQNQKPLPRWYLKW